MRLGAQARIFRMAGRQAMWRVALVFVSLVAGSRPSLAVELGVLAELTGNATWGVALGGDTRAPGFSIQGGGVDALIGLEIRGVAGLLGGARVRSARGTRANYLAFAGDLAAQLRVAERVRLRLGASLGRAFVDPDPSATIAQSRSTATLAGGFLATTFDMRTLANGRFALVFHIQLDLDTYLTSTTDFPDLALALSCGLGARY